MNKGALLYEGKGKKLFFTDDEDLLISEFKDDLTAFNAEKRGNEAGKGALNCKISTQLFNLLSKHGIQTHLVKTLDDTHQLIKKVKIIPIEVVVRNIATGSLSKRNSNVCNSSKVGQIPTTFIGLTPVHNSTSLKNLSLELFPFIAIL